MLKSGDNAAQEFLISMCSLKQKSSGNMCLPPHVCFSPHFHESGNEHLSLLPTSLNIHGHATFLLPSFLSRSVSSPVFHSKNLDVWIFYDQLQWHSHFQKQLMALRTPSQTSTACVSPPGVPGWGIGCLSAAMCLFPMWQGFPLFFFCWTLLSRFWQTFCQSYLDNHLLQKAGWESSVFVPGWLHWWLTECWGTNTAVPVDNLLPGTGRAVLCCRELLVTSWAFPVLWITAELTF